MIKNSKLVLFIFIVTVFFQITAYKFIWGVEWVSRFSNLAALVITSVYAFKSLKHKYNYRIYYYYIMPGMMIVTGILINIIINSYNNINNINQIATIMSWMVYLIIPILMKFKNLDVLSLWKYFNYFMIGTVFLSTLEYIALFAGYITPRSIMTSGGPFLAGNFSMLHELETGDFHYRFYASFLEPGTLAMFILPAMAYAFLLRKYISLLIYSIAMISSDSLGGFIGVAMLIILMVFYKYRKKLIVSITAVMVVVVLMGLFFGNDLKERYEQKNKTESAAVREKNTSDFVKNLPNLFINYPFGLPLTESTEEAEKNPSYFGSNFSPGVVYNIGGIISFLGYIIIIFISMWYSLVNFFSKNLAIEEQVVVITLMCMLPFIFQRSSLWDSNIFSLLYAPFIVSFLKNAEIFPLDNKIKRSIN